MGRPKIWLVWLAMVGASLALDIAGSYGKYLINKATNNLITINGIWYTLSNSTTDAFKMDPLTDAQACTRDAALMQRLGLNTIHVQSLDATQNHDECFSIFNSVGIYVIVLLRPYPLFPEDPSQAYTEAIMEGTFKVIDAVKDYENLLAINVGEFPTSSAISIGSYAEAMLLFRAFVRDTKEYVLKNAPRAILIGSSLVYDPANQALDRDLYNYFQCLVKNATDDTSHPDFIGWETDIFADEPANASSAAYSVLNNLTNVFSSPSIPMWVNYYESWDLGDGTQPVFDPSLSDTAMLFNTSANLLAPQGDLNGGIRYKWANVGQNSDSLSYMVMIDADGNIQLTDTYDRLQSIFAPLNTESFLSGANPLVYSGITTFENDNCDSSLIRNATATNNVGDSITLATEWSMPTRPGGLDAVITSGAKGARGQMIDVITTTHTHTVKDSSGKVLTDVTIEPSKSSARSTTAAATGGGTSTSKPSSGLSTGAKVGIGVGAAAGVLALVGIGSFLLWRRKSKGKKATEAVPDGPGAGATHEKPELSAEPRHAAVDYELAATMDGPPVELMAPHHTHELGGDDGWIRDTARR